MRGGGLQRLCYEYSLSPGVPSALRSQRPFWIPLLLLPACRPPACRPPPLPHAATGPFLDGASVFRLLEEQRVTHTAVGLVGGGVGGGGGGSHGWWCRGSSGGTASEPQRPPHHPQGVPTVWLGLADLMERQRLRLSGQLRLMVVGGAACPR